MYLIKRYIIDSSNFSELTNSILFKNIINLLLKHIKTISFTALLSEKHILQDMVFHDAL